ncbi:hypothetical protein BGZ99_008043 [Dissophora globulifera]|uniref:Tyrosine specific protein phosphatases domain-containing protein n=1 Tax=Dissophora globulifera TaxID=979702 RepID=A0A9P6UPX0_9FUNG|nr:hypothetical protein BGZ99_008043 [Dissophora globulifera]
MSVPWLPPPLIPPFRFGTVEPEVYRGAYPKQRNLRYLKRLKLRTILSLIPDSPDQIFEEFCAQQGIRSIHLPVDKVKDNVPLTYNRAVEAVQIIIDQENLPIYVHCLDGASVTGLVICCLRKLQTWSISSAMGEFLRYLRGGVISSEEAVFVEKFSSEIEISKPIPPWLWEGQISFKKHPTLKLNFTISPAMAAASNASNTSVSSPNLLSQSTVIVFPAVPGDGFAQGGSNGASGNSDGSYHSAMTGTETFTHGGFGSGSTGPGDGALVSSRTMGSSTKANTASGSGTGSGTGAGVTDANSSNSLTNSTLSTSSTSAYSTVAGMQSHASRSSAKNTVRDRSSNHKTTLRADVLGGTGFASRTNSIETPTTAAQARNKRENAPGVTGQRQQQHQQQQGLSQDPFQHDVIGAGSGIGAQGPAQSLGGSNSENSGTATDRTVGSRTNNAINSRTGDRSTHGGGHGSTSSEGDAATTKESSAQDGQKADDSSTDGAGLLSAPSQDRSLTTTPTILKSSPATTAAAAVTVAEVVDEYYEVSMTLKALALEGADF